MRKTGAAADAFQKTKAADATGGEPMNSFVTSLLAVAALAELAGALSPPKARDPIRRIAFLAALLVLIAPIRALCFRAPPICWIRIWRSIPPPRTAG